MYPIGPNPTCTKCGREGSHHSGVKCNRCGGYFCDYCIMKPTFVGKTVRLHGESPTSVSECPSCKSIDIVNLMHIIY